MRISLLNSIYLVCFGSLPLAYGQNIDPECACNLGNLWLDVVVVIDNSKNMDHNGLNTVAANIATVFAQSNITQALGQTTRVGIVTYGQTATVQYNLTAFDDTNTFINTIFDVANKPTTDTESDIYTGLYAARDALYDGRMNGKRDNVRQAIILYASDYRTQGLENDPVQLAQNIKANGIDIITVGFSQFGGNLLAGLAKIATPGMAFNDTETDLVVNCFCPNGWTQYTSQLGLASARRFAVCLQFGSISSMWTATRSDCQHLDNSAYLVSEFDETKHNFIYQFFKSKSGIPSPYIYHIGLSWDAPSQQWMWEQYVNQPKLSLNGSSYTEWNPGEPQSPSTNPCVTNRQLAPDASPGWSTENCYTVSERYVCQMGACDTDHYCKAA
ncbi:hypothetical protein WR25_02418 [Diploscapter pachys]|uniref:VWFA domain-containing protein n=1 Tax=Diploscapter pachys TaxID=2018661 RepID=A0A2A2KK50_9BILA|nr:hypothetical protein WR25_02418 [Diploscapter pachys]